MTREELDLVLDLLVRSGQRLPHNQHPGAPLGGASGIVTQEEWESYNWNPDISSNIQERDPNASRKPSWLRIQSLVPVALLVYKREEIQSELRKEVRRRIMQDVFGAETIEDEIFLRLSGNNSAAQLQQRKDLLWRYRLLKSDLPRLSLEELIQYDSFDGSRWI